VSQENVLRLFSASQPWFDFGQHDVWTLFHACTFDFSVWELWGALLEGGRLVVVPYWVSRSPQAFATLLEREQVSVLNQTPAAFRQLLAVAEVQQPSWGKALRQIIFGGEALESARLQDWVAAHGGQRPALVNMYGITETTVHVTYARLSAAEVLAAGRGGSRIGRPLADLGVYLLDRQLQPVPLGALGELYVGGAGLARGYWGRPDLTGQRFLPHPFSRQPGARLYRSGDLARWRASGQLEYAGRCDQQVKIRGFRIELGEIEAVLQEQPAVRQALVVARPDPDGTSRLVAYLVLADPAVSDDQLRRQLQRQLPDYMLPASLVRLTHLPLTPSGKIDRAALPPPDTQRPHLQTAYAPPRDPLEQALAQLWSQVLGVQQVGIHDNFFELGAIR
jgi:amino acid adenylation domain-containing protein